MVKGVCTERRAQTQTLADLRPYRRRRNLRFVFDHATDPSVATGRVLRSVARRMRRMERRPLGVALLFSPIIILRDLARARSRFLLRRRYLFDDSLLLNYSLLRRCLFNASLRGHRLFPRSLLFR